MTFIRRFQKTISIFVLLLFSGMMISPAQAALVGNDALISQALHDQKVEQVISLLEKTEVQQQLISLGVDPIAAKQRISQLTDQELAALMDDMENLPAGGDLGSLLLLLFIVFIITDMLGATDIFPFVKNINK